MSTTTTFDILDILKQAQDHWRGKAVDNGATPINEIALAIKRRFDGGYFGDFYRTTYIVEGSGEFPFDMLRYAASFPADEQASYLMRSEHTEKRQVKLCRYHRDEKPTLSNDRWVRKFHWEVVEVVETTPL